MYPTAVPNEAEYPIGDAGEDFIGIKELVLNETNKKFTCGFWQNTENSSLERALPDSYEKLPQTPRRGCTECYNKNNTQTALPASIREL